MLARIVDEPWFTCTKTSTLRGETSDIRSENEATERLKEMTPLPEPPPWLDIHDHGPPPETFRAWWRAHRASPVTPP